MQHERCPTPGLGVELELATELVDHDPSDDVHAETPPARRRGLGPSGQSRLTEQIEERGIVRRSLTARAAGDRGDVDARSVILDRQYDARARTGDTLDADDPFGGLSRALALRGHLDAVVDRVTHDVDDGGEDEIGHGLVEFSLAALELEARLPATDALEGAHDERKPLEELRDRHHSHLKDAGSQVAQLPGVLLGNLRQLAR